MPELKLQTPEPEAPIQQADSLRIDDKELAEDLAYIEKPYREIAIAAIAIGSHMGEVHDTILSQANLAIANRLRDHDEALSRGLNEIYRETYISRDDIEDYLVEIKKAKNPKAFINPYTGWGYLERVKRDNWKPFIVNERQRASGLWNTLNQFAVTELRPDYDGGLTRMSLVFDDSAEDKTIRFDSLIEVADKYTTAKRRNPDIKASSLFGTGIGDAKAQLLVDFVDHKKAQLTDLTTIEE